MEVIELVRRDLLNMVVTRTGPVADKEKERMKITNEFLEV